MAHQMHDAGLDRGVREGSCDRLGEALQPVHNGDQNVLHPSVLQLVHHRKPEFGSFILSDPQAKNLTDPLTCHTQGHVDGLVFDHPAVSIPDFDPERIEDHDRIHAFQCP